MLKETESEETIGFLHIFVTGGILIGGEGAPLWLRLWFENEL